MSTTIADVATRARDDIDVFARVLVGEALWPHQLSVARSKARTRCICSGRQAGKSRTLALLALHEAFSASDRRVLVLSAGEDAAKDLLREISALASSSLLAGSVVDDNASTITLTNGSTIRSVPASERQIRGKAVDLLILDEAAFIDDSLWRAARYTVIARPNSRIVMASTPFGRRDRFFAITYRAGLDKRGRALDVESFHWPSTVSPLVDRELLKAWRPTMTDREYRTEVLAEWVDDAGAYFTFDELAIAEEHDYPMVEPEHAMGLPVIGGIDWGFARDANAVVLVAQGVPQDHPVAHDHPARRGAAFWIPLAEEHYGKGYEAFIDRVVELGDAFTFGRVSSETNGVGEMPTQVLRRRLLEGRRAKDVVGIHTDTRSKEDQFGSIKLLLQQGRLLLPRHPALLRQLAALEYESLDGGSMRIAVPERAGHDDLAMAFALAMSGEVETASRWSGGHTGPLRVIDRRLSGRRGGGRPAGLDDNARKLVERYAAMGHAGCQEMLKRTPRRAR